MKDAKDEKAKAKAKKRHIEAATRQIATMTQLLQEEVPGQKRLNFDIPLDGKGQVRISITGDGHRTSAWGDGIEDAMHRLLEKISAP